MARADISMSALAELCPQYARRAGFPPPPTAVAAARALPSPEPGSPVFVVTQPGGGLDLAIRVTPDSDPSAPGSAHAAYAKAQAVTRGAPLLQTGANAHWWPGCESAACKALLIRMFGIFTRFRVCARLGARNENDEHVQPGPEQSACALQARRKRPARRQRSTRCRASQALVGP